MDPNRKQDGFQRIEQKYLFPLASREMILSWLDHACIPDPSFPYSDVSTLYYDTPELAHFHEGSNGNFVRAKVRLRWYPKAELGGRDHDADVPGYLEIKTKQGALSGKQRFAVIIPRRSLIQDPFSDSWILELPTQVFELNFKPTNILVPVAQVQYRRRRYLDPGSQSGIAVDTEICCTRCNVNVISGMPPVHFPMGILESKGMNRTLPKALAPIGSCLAKSRFSKYGVSLQSLMQPLGRRE
jgi:hypothetical protein